MSWITVILLVLGAFAATFAGLQTLIPVLARRGILDRPNPRSNHATPTPRGGGLALIAVLVGVWGLAALIFGDPIEGQSEIARLAPLLSAALLLSAISWLDDLHSLPPLLRLVAHFATAGAGLSALPETDLVFQGVLPFWGDRFGALLLWVWFLNLFNFMDGIDGLSGSEAASIALGAGLVLLSITGLGFAPDVQIVYALTLAGGAVAFLCWNWEPAKVFMGDAGSVPLGFLLGWLLLSLAGEGLFFAALILPLYYLADSGLTLITRILRREKIWQAHSTHFYQRAVRSGMSHAGVTRLVLVANLGLILLALGAQSDIFSNAGPACLLGAGLVVAGLLRRLSRKNRA